MSTLSTSIESIKNSNLSNAEKRVELIKLGLMPVEATELTLSWATPRQPGVPREKYTFGIELEVVGITSRITMLNNAAAQGLTAAFEGYNHVDNNHYFKFVRDASIAGVGGIECVSPILNQGQTGMQAIKRICTALAASGASVNRSTGFHVHVGGNITDQQFVNVFVNYQRLERVINAFLAPSRRNCQWCESLFAYRLDNCTTPGQVNDVIPNRYFCVNPRSWARHHTIEFRQHQGTINEAKIKNWVNFCIKLVAWSRDNVFESRINSVDDIPFLTQREKNYFKSRAAKFAARA